MLDINMTLDQIMYQKMNETADYHTWYKNPGKKINVLVAVINTKTKGTLQ